jgi:hypothetical protein
MTCTMSYEPMAGRAACRHVPRCPSATAADWAAARTVIAHPEQGWSLLCNGVVLFDDTGGLLPDGNVAAPHVPALALAEISRPRAGRPATRLRRR